MKFTPFTMTPADVQLLDNKKFTVKEIGRFFRVPPSMLYEDGGSTYSNAEMDSVLFLNGALSPLLRQIELELSSKLIADEERGYYKIQFDREALYTTDLTTKANYMKATIESGVRTVNEWRKAEGFPALVGGDEAVVSANLVTLKSRINEGQQEGNTQP
jgi:HK97 family phage portal protein